MVTLLLTRITENQQQWVEICGEISAVIEMAIATFYAAKAVFKKIKDLINKKDKEQ